MLLHALGTDGAMWAPVLDRLAAERDVIVPDVPGFGRSPVLANGDASPRALAAAVSELLGELGVERPHVAGNSLGGWVALELALAGSTAVAAVLLTASGG